MAINKYQSPAELSSAYIVKLEDLIRELISEHNIGYYRIESEMHDGAAESDSTPIIKIVTYFENSIAPIVSVLNDEFEVKMEQPSGAQKIAMDSFASKRLAYDVALKANRRELAEYRKYGNSVFKIHICSMMQDAWAGIERELGYDSGSIPDDARRDFYRVGALLEMADLEFLKIRSKLNKEHAGAQESPAAPVLEATPTARQMQAPVQVAEEQPVQQEQHSAIFASKPIVAEPEVQAPPPPKQEEHVFMMPAAEEKRPEQTKFNESNSRLNVTANGIVEKAGYSFGGQQLLKGSFDEKQRGNGQVMIDEHAPMTEQTLKEYVLNSKLLYETDAQIAANAGARLNNDIDIEGDIERLRFLKVSSLKQLHERIAENKREIIAFAEKWIGKDNGGTFDKGISLFYLEYLLVARKNDPAFAVEYVLKFISDNEYSARYIIPTYESIMEASNGSTGKFSHLTLK